MEENAKKEQLLAQWVDRYGQNTPQVWISFFFIKLHIGSVEQLKV